MRGARGALRIGLVLAVASAATSVASAARADVASCIAASEQSITLRQQGRLHDALEQLAGCADPSCPGEVAAECTRRITDIDAAMPTLILAAKDGAGNDLYDVTVTMDGAPLATKLDGRPLSLDPGEHAFHLETPGQPPVDKKLVLREGEKDRRESVTIGAPPPLLVAPQAAPAPSPWDTQRTLAVVSAGIGVVGLGLGAVFGAFAIASQNDEKSDCSASSCPRYKQSAADYDTAGKDATGSTVSFIAGGVFLAAGAVLWFTSPRRATTTTGALRVVPQVSDRSAGVTAFGAF